MLRLLRLIRTEHPRNGREVRAFVLGVREFRLMSTTNPGDDLIEVYDLGRELAHAATLRRFEP